MKAVTWWPAWSAESTAATPTFPAAPNTRTFIVVAGRSLTRDTPGKGQFCSTRKRPKNPAKYSTGSGAIHIIACMLRNR